MSHVSKAHVVKAAMAVATDVTEGRLQPAAVEAAAVEACRELFGVVHGPGDPLWEVHRDVVRQFLAMGGMPADELAEWLAVQRQREGKPVVEPEVSWIERALAEGADEDDG
ncbi:flagellar hook-length control protein [Mycobacterium sp. MBM]|nr:flagellar hook-length control protein [Mycobacterium sp. MBM]